MYFPRSKVKDSYISNCVKKKQNLTIHRQQKIVHDNLAMLYLTTKTVLANLVARKSNMKILKENKLEILAAITILYVVFGYMGVL